jgi:RAT1-interacting protein
VGAGHPGLEACVELKTNKVVENEKQEVIFHKWVRRGVATSSIPHMPMPRLTWVYADDTRKLLKHWAQSWLLGIPVRSTQLVMQI